MKVWLYCFLMIRRVEIADKTSIHAICNRGDCTLRLVCGSFRRIIFRRKQECKSRLTSGKYRILQRLLIPSTVKYDSRTVQPVRHYCSFPELSRIYFITNREKGIIEAKPRTDEAELRLKKLAYDTNKSQATEKEIEGAFFSSKIGILALNVRGALGMVIFVLFKETGSSLEVHLEKNVR